MNAKPKRRRRIWPWIAAIIVIVIVAIAVSNTLRQAGLTPTASPSTPTATSTAVADGAPTGCLGGNARDAAMIIAAANQANAGESGAVDLAASFVRWFQRYPYPTADEASKVQPELLAEESFTKDLVAYLAAEPDLSGGIVPRNTPYYMSTVPGAWHVESSTSDQVVVSIGTGFVVNGELSSTLRSSITITLHSEAGRWRIANADGTRTPADLYKIAQAFTGGC